MKLASALAVLGSSATALAGHQQAMGSDDSAQADAAGHRVPTSYESAVMGRRILGLSKLATFSTIFPSESKSAADHGVAGQPIGLVDYVADCEDEGNPTVLAIKIGTTFRNVDAGSNLTVSMQWVPPYPPAKRLGVARRALSWVPFLGRSDDGVPPNPADPSIPDTVPYSADNLARFALFGYLEKFNASATQAEDLKECYLQKHPDSTYWMPGNHIHTSEWVRMVVTKIYWVGGFGDRAYIGWIPVEEWNKVTEKEWQAIKLPGEKKDWNEDTVYDDNQEL
ncbi:FMN-binding split barrel-related protein [Cordyceps javanica]|uniref:FMN-binding split barrel-related protein n=1 Tax=Cordyceps javanica TaxID=43265 RepID=A0A545UUV9_9HYPO|nr:FMN-binding split barrel-related protein [Cordyceps javanica]TQW05398.1 FMN-binding split barrel-related protein [Cordyceps javanica]